jgi:hypothetical protein
VISLGLFISSIIAGFLGFYIGGVIGASDIWIVAFGLIGFSFPYAITLDKIYHMLMKCDKDSISNEYTEDMDYDISKVPQNKCPACFTEVSELEDRCPSCGLALIEE